MYELSSLRTPLRVYVEVVLYDGSNGGAWDTIVELGQHRVLPHLVEVVSDMS